MAARLRTLVNDRVLTSADDEPAARFRQRITERYGDDYEKAFRDFAISDPSQITRSEWKKAVRSMGMVLSDDARKVLRKQLDTNNEKKITLQAFKKFMRDGEGSRRVSTINLTLPEIGSTANRSSGGKTPRRDSSRSQSRKHRGQTPVPPLESAGHKSPRKASVAEPSQELLDVFTCPITWEIMTDPVIAGDGHTYERDAMEDWLKNHETSPKTNAPLPHKMLIPNHAIKGLISELMEKKRKGKQQ